MAGRNTGWALTTDQTWQVWTPAGPEGISTWQVEITGWAVGRDWIQHGSSEHRLGLVPNSTWQVDLTSNHDF